VPCFLAEALSKKAETLSGKEKIQLLRRATEAEQQGQAIAKNFPLIRPLALRMQALVLHAGGQSREAQRAAAEALAVAKSQQQRLEEEQCVLLQEKLR
jgi:hypothetical protein